jgi:acetyltransferase-like isoleucine patch superfamily enzyme
MDLNPAGLRRLAKEWVDEPMKGVVLRARLQRPWRLRRFHAFGQASIVHKPMWIYGPHQISIGTSTLMLHGVWLSVERVAWDRPAPVLRIGSFVSVRPHCTIAAAESVIIEDGVVLSAHSTVLDADHTFTEGRRTVMHSPVVTAPTRIGAGTWVGERVAVLRGADIGRGCVIGANSVVKGVIPDGSIAVGAPARVVGQVDRRPAP